MHRPTVGIIALLSLFGGVFLWLWPLSWQGSEALCGALLRIGIVMATLWTALPQLRRIPGWIVQAVTVAALLFAVRPRLALLAIPVLIVYLILRPRKRRGLRSSPVESSVESRERRSERDY